MGCNLERLIPFPEERRTVKEREKAWMSIKSELPIRKTLEERDLRRAMFDSMKQENAQTITMDEVFHGFMDRLHLDKFTSRLRYLVRRSFRKVKKFLERDENEECADFQEFCLIISYVYFRFEFRTMLDGFFPEGKEEFTFEDFQTVVPNIKEWGVRIASVSRVFKDIDKKSKESITFEQFASWACGKKLAVEGDPNNFETAAE